MLQRIKLANERAKDPAWGYNKFVKGSQQVMYRLVFLMFAFLLGISGIDQEPIEFEVASTTVGYFLLLASLIIAGSYLREAYDWYKQRSVKKL